MGFASIMTRSLPKADVIRVHPAARMFRIRQRRDGRRLRFHEQSCRVVNDRLADVRKSDAMSNPSRRGPKRKTDLPLRTAEALLALSAPPRAGAWGSLCSNAVVLRIGRLAAEVELNLLFANVSSLGEGFRAIWAGRDGATALMELELRTKGSVDPLPLVIVLRALEPAPVIRDLRLYMDPGPLMLDRLLNGGDDKAQAG
jgi:hypothetical protein